jgi:hypothetical protein
VQRTFDLFVAALAITVVLEVQAESSRAEEQERVAT